MNPANRMSSRLFTETGIARGMRVLDLGCGGGDLTRTAARHVGAAGEVIGVDIGDDGLALARAHPVEADAAPIRYVRADLTASLPDLGRFDAVVVRRVLMYLPDPAQTLARVRDLLVPGGIFAAQEHARTGCPISRAPLPLHRQLHDWMWETVAREGGHVELALDLAAMLRTVGFDEPSLHAEAVTFAPDTPSTLGTIMGAMAPRMERLGVTTAAAVDSATLDARLEAERRESNAAMVWDIAYFITARAPGAA